MTFPINLVPFHLSNLRFGDTYYFNHYVLTNKNEGYVSLERLSDELYELVISTKNYSPVDKIKITNFSILEWIDDWRQDPKIKTLNLSNNQLTKVHIPKSREFLTELNLRNNIELRELIVESAPKMRKLIIEECFALETLKIMNSPDLSYVNALNCKLSTPQVNSLIDAISLNNIWTSRGTIDIRGNDFPTTTDKFQILMNSDWEVLIE